MTEPKQRKPPLSKRLEAANMGLIEAHRLIVAARTAAIDAGDKYNEGKLDAALSALRHVWIDRS